MTMTIKEAITSGIGSSDSVTLKGVTFEEVSAVAAEMGYECYPIWIRPRAWNGNVGYLNVDGWPPGWDEDADDAHDLVWCLHLI